MSRVRARVRALLVPALLAPILALPGCMASHFAPLSPGRQSPDALRGGADASARWWQCLDDTQLSVLIERALEPGQPSPPTLAQDSLTAAIASRYIALRSQQTALVLLAAREDIDRQLVTSARQRFSSGAAPRRAVAAAQEQLADTRANQARTRAEIAALRDRLAILTGSAPDALARMAGGPIPLPPVALVVGADPESPLGRYAAAQLAARQAQSQAEHARTIAALQDIRVRAAAVAPGDALAANRQALEALEAEEQARAAATEAYVALATSSRWILAVEPRHRAAR